MIGTIAPDFKLADQDGNWVTLSEAFAQGPVMLVFYPGDFTPVCTKQLCAYQESYGEFGKYGIRILGVSKNSPEQHREFRKKYGFAFPLLSDPGREVTKLYGVSSLLMLGGMSRAVLIIGKGGRVLYRYVEPTALTHRRPGELLRALEELRLAGQL